MANRYTYHGGSNTSPYDTWAKAATTLTTAMSGSAAGDDFWIASDHSESTASAVTITLPGTGTAPSRVISVDRTGSEPPVAADILAGAVVTNTGTNALVVTGGGPNYIYGITFNCATGSGNVNLSLGTTGNGFLKFESCAFNLVTTHASARIAFGTSSSVQLDLNNCTVSFGSTSQGINYNGSFNWANKPGSSAITGANIPTSLLKLGSSRGKNTLSGLDLSAMGSGTTLVANSVEGPMIIVNCKLDASVTVAATPFQSGARGIYLIGSSSTGVVRREEIYLYQGTFTTETTIIRTAGASDGTTAYSWKVVTTANAKRTHPFETLGGEVWNTTLSSRTLTVHTVTDNVTLTDAEIWLEAEYLASSATPVSSFISDAPATILTAGANQASDSGEAWTTTGLTTPLKQKLEVTFTPAMIGLVRWRVYVAKASTTVYIDPNADIA